MECNKVIYRTESDADVDIDRHRKTSKRTVLPIRAYFCYKCKGWHISSAGKYNMQIRIEELENELSEIISAKSKLNEGYKALQRIIAEKDLQIRWLKKKNRS